MSQCWFIKEPPKVKVTLIYIHPVIHEGFMDVARRFVQTFEQFPPGYPHRTVIICNGGQASQVSRSIFAPIAGCEFIPHTNEAYDVSSYQFASRTFPCDLMLFFGASSYFRNAGWMKRVVDSFIKHGDGLYGATANRGVQGHCYPHVRSTGFWIPPSLFNQYPHRITRPDMRYGFEHGKESLTGWVAREGYPTLVVTTDNEYPWSDWDAFPGGYHRNNQEVMLFGDRLTCPPYFAVP